MDIKLWYGDGFAGRTYTMQLGNDYLIIGSGLGGNDDEISAREKAIDLLKQWQIDFDLKDAPFEWDGTL